jgi:hypothetical protein
MRPFRTSPLVVAVGALVAIAAASILSPSIEVRSFDGVGSLDTSSPVEVYLLAGTYHHRLVGSTECYTTASLFPSRDPDGVLLADVLQGDLSVGRKTTGAAEVSPTGTVIISQPGWARLQVGTGLDCTWKYSITGSFLPEGDEPESPSQRSMWWLPIAGVAVVVSLTVLALRRGSPKSRENEEGPIRLVDPDGEG